MLLMQLAGLILLAPLLIIIAAGVKLTSPGPVLFKQYRAGVNGRQFLFYKFRSMVADAEARTGPVFATAGDARVAVTRSLARCLR